MCEVRLGASRCARKFAGRRMGDKRVKDGRSPGCRMASASCCTTKLNAPSHVEHEAATLTTVEWLGEFGATQGHEVRNGPQILALASPACTGLWLAFSHGGICPSARRRHAFRK